MRESLKKKKKPAAAAAAKADDGKCFACLVASRFQLLTTPSAARCACESSLKSAERTESHSGQEAQGTQRGTDIDSVAG